MIKQHLINKKSYYISSIILIVGFLVIFAVFGAWPFGSKTIAHYDMYHQIIPFLELIFDAIEGKSSLIYSNFVAGGANIVGFLCYLVFNPFYLLLLPFGPGNLWFGINLVFILNITSIDIVFIWFIRKYFNINNTHQIALGILYALNPFILFNYTYITWLMLPLLLPLLVHFFIKIIKGKGFVGFTITAICMIFTCYGIGLMGHIILFVLFTIFTLTVLPKHKHKEVLNKLLLAYALTLFCSLFFLGPNFLQIKESSRLGNGFFHEILNKGLFKNVIYGTTFLMINPILLSLNIFFLIKYAKKSRYTQFLMISLVICFIPIIIDGITLMLSMGGYYGYNMRLAYISCFVSYLAVIYTIKHLKRPFGQIINIEKYTQKTIATILSLSVIVCVLCAVFTFQLLSYILSHSIATYHTIGFISLMYIPFIVIAIISLIKFSKGKFSQKFLNITLSIILIIPLLLNSFLFTGVGFYDISKPKFWETQNISLNLGDVRLKESEGTVGSNLHLTSDFSSLSGFASQINAAPVEIGKIFGYYYSGNAIGSDGGTILSDSFLGYKYVYTQINQNRPYLEYIDKHIVDNQSYYLYENKMALNNAILIPNNSHFEFSDDLGENISALYKYLGGTENIITKYSIQDKINDGSISFENLSISNNQFDINNNDNGIINISNISNNYNKIIYCEFNEKSSFDFTIDAQPITQTIYSNKLYDMGFAEKDKEYTYQIVIKKPTDFEDITIYELNYDLVESLLLSLQNQTVDFEFTKTGYNIDVVSNNQKLVVTNANISGNKITVNNVSVSPNDLPFIEINLNNGKNHVESRYVYPYTKTFIICIVFGVLSIVAVIVINKYFINKPKFKNFLYYTSLVAFGGALTLIYFVPSVIFIVRLVLFKF